MDCFQHFSLCYLPYPDCHWKKKVRVLPPSSFPLLGFQVTRTKKYDIRSCTYLPKVNNYIKHGSRENNLGIELFGTLYLPLSSCQCRLLLLFDPKQLFGVRMHYLNDPLCFSQSGGCRRLINLTCLLFPVRSDTHCIFKTCIKTPTPFLPVPVPFCSPIKTNALFINHQIIIQIDEIVIYANEQKMGR